MLAFGVIGALFTLTISFWIFAIASEEEESDDNT